jgi:outer membrane lipoprotein SlyB
MRRGQWIRIVLVIAATGLSACATTDEPYRTTDPRTSGEPTYPVQQAHRYGYVETIEVVNADRREGIGVGAVAGAIAGGVLGSQIGSGSGRTAATVGGAVLGGVVGHQVEQRVRGSPEAGTEYAIRVRMDDGSYQTFRQPTQGNIRVGDRVRIEGGAIYPM